MTRLLKNNGAIKFYASQVQKDKAAVLIAKELEMSDSAFIVPQGETAMAIATDAVNEACETPFVVTNVSPDSQIYDRALRVMKTWTEADEYEIDEQTERDNINRLEALKEQLSDCLHIPLIGSPKQISWAESIRVKKLQELAVEVLEKRVKIEAAAAILSSPSAKWWIENK